MFKNLATPLLVALFAAGLGIPLIGDAAPAAQGDATSARGATSLGTAPDVEGDWGGTLDGALRVVLHIRKSPDGRYTAVLETVDQGRGMLPVDKIEVTADRLAFSSKVVQGTFDGKWDGAAKAWVGSWTQVTAKPLSLTRADGERFRARRPQEDAIKAAPAPYSQQDVSFDGGTAGVRLAGTLTIPPGAGPFPAVVLVAGSGPQKRDEEVLGHKVFLVLADYLTRRGIAVLRYDKRGCGTSSGDYRNATTLDFTADARAAAAFLRSRPEVDLRHVGLIGHSEGGAIAPAVIVQDDRIGFIVLLAAPAVRGDKLLAQQIYLVGRAAGLPDEKGIPIRAVNEELFTAIARAPTPTEARIRGEAIIDKAFAEKKLTGDVVKVKAGLSQVLSPWMRHFLDYDPVPILRQVRVPVLALNGALDLQVPAREDLAAMREALQGAPDATIMELAGLNHLFQSAATGSPGEYGAIEETINPAALNVIGEWLSNHVK